MGLAGVHHDDTVKKRQEMRERPDTSKGQCRRISCLGWFIAGATYTHDSNLDRDS